MSWKRIVGDKDKQGLLGEAFKKERGNPIPPNKIVPVDKKNPRKDRRKNKDALRNFDLEN